MKNPATNSFAALAAIAVRPAVRFAARFAALAAHSAALAVAAMSFVALAPSSASAVTATKAYVDSRDAALAAAADSALSAASNALATAIAKAEPGNYAAVSNAAMSALQPAATNGLASAASVAQEAKDREDADAKTAAALAAHAAANNNPHGVTAAQVGALTAESDPSTALTNGTAYVRGKKVISEHQSLDAYLEITNLSKHVNSITIGLLSDKYHGDVKTTLVAPLLGEANVIARSSFYAPEYVDFLLSARATTNALAAVEAKIPVISATDATFSNAVNVAARALVKAKLESLDKAKSSIGETIAALQSIYETETK